MILKLGKDNVHFATALLFLVFWLIKGTLQILYYAFTNICQESRMLKMVIQWKKSEKVSGECMPPQPRLKLVPAALHIHDHGVESY